MNIQQHPRTERIKKLSRYLYRVLSVIHYLFCVLWPLTLMWLLFGTKGELKFFDAPITPESLSLLQCLLIAIPISLLYFLLLKVTYHFRQLILHFASGDIFNIKTTEHARKALLHALVIYAVFIISSVVLWGYSIINNQPINLVLNGKYLFALIIFGLMYVLLWTLEIGCDLNEESELTI